MVQGSNLGGGKRFSLLLTHSDQPWGPHIHICNRYLGPFTGVKRPGYGFDNHPVLASRLRRGRAIRVHTLCSYIGMCTRWPLPSLRSRFVQLVTDCWDLWQYLELFHSCRNIILKSLFDHKFLLHHCVLVQWMPYTGVCFLQIVSWWKDFRRYRKIAKKRILDLLSLSVCPNTKPRLPLQEFSWNFIFEGFSKICWKYSCFIKIWWE